MVAVPAEPVGVVERIRSAWLDKVDAAGIGLGLVPLVLFGTAALLG